MAGRLNVGGAIWNVDGWVCVFVCVWRFTTMILHRGHTRTVSYRDWMRGEEARGGGWKRKCVRAGEEGVLFLHV